MFETWHITKSKDACSGCGSELPESRAFFSGLAEEDAEFVRHDFCPSCWGKGKPGDIFCFWKTSRRRSEKRTADASLLWEFFDRLDNPDTPKKRVFRFVLALYLMRRKELKLAEVSREAEGEVLVCRRRAGGQTVRVDNPGLTEAQIEETAVQLGQLLNAGL